MSDPEKPTGPPSPASAERARTALVTGASSGIGEEYARRLAQRGYALVVVARRGELLEELAEELRGRYGAEVEVLSADLGTPEGVAAVAERLAADGTGDPAPIDLLVNNAGRGDGGTFAEQDPGEIDAMIDLNVRQLVHACSAGAAAMKQTGGSIINVGSISARTGGSPGSSIYSGAKAFVSTFSRSLARELAPGVVALVAEQLLYTPMSRGLTTGACDAEGTGP